MKGVAFDGEGWLAKDRDGEWYRIGDEYCKLTREEAKKVLEETENKKSHRSDAPMVAEPIDKI